MGLLSAVFGFPLVPVRGVISLGELIQRRVEEEQTDPAAVRRELEGAAEARAAGEISAEEEREAQQEVLDRLTPSDPAPDEER